MENTCTNILRKYTRGSLLYLLESTVFTGVYCIYWSLLYLLEPTVFTGVYCIYWSLLYLLQKEEAWNGSTETGCGEMDWI